MEIQERLPVFKSMLLAFFQDRGIPSDMPELAVADAMRIVTKLAAQFTPDGFVFATPHNPRGAGAGLVLALEQFTHAKERVTIRMVSAKEPLGDIPSWAQSQSVRDVLSQSYGKQYMRIIRESLSLGDLHRNDRVLRGMVEWLFGETHEIAANLERAYPLLSDGVRTDVAQTMLFTLTMHLLIVHTALHDERRHAAIMASAPLLFRELAEHLPQTVMLGPAAENNRGGLHLLMLRS